MPEGPDGKTIIIVKKVSGHGGHHGGAWKVAFADFVTAMMALFMVLWLVNSASVVTREKIASYFRRPGVFEKGSGTPLETGGAGILPDAFSPPVEGNAAISPSEPPYNIADPSGKNTEGFGRGEGLEDGDVGHAVPQDGVKIQIMAKEIKENLQEAIQEDGGVGSDYYGQGLGDYLGEAQPPQPPKPEVAANEQAPTAEQMKSDEAAIKKEVENLSKEATKDNPLGEIDVVIDQRGIHIEIMDTEKTSMFQVGSASIRGDAESALDKIAQLMK
jgi:chemotaxis protein MotB